MARGEVEVAKMVLQQIYTFFSRAFKTSKSICADQDHRFLRAPLGPDRKIETTNETIYSLDQHPRDAIHQHPARIAEFLLVLLGHFGALEVVLLLKLHADLVLHLRLPLLVLLLDEQHLLLLLAQQLLQLLLLPLEQLSFLEREFVLEPLALGLEFEVGFLLQQFALLFHQILDPRVLLLPHLREFLLVLFQLALLHLFAYRHSPFHVALFLFRHGFEFFPFLLELFPLLENLLAEVALRFLQRLRVQG
mmetsp:Transcript_11720/g.28448  ORF Transcript_11720/g.28448 Transcript_11720/m.28448 type:complete len:249 (-) Transcript_11720:807-1553(-)